MVESLSDLLKELEAFGEVNDRQASDHSRRMLNITRETGRFFSFLVRAAGARRILEVGTSNGYSTLWLAEAARATGGHVTTVEISAEKVELASRNFGRSGLSARISQIHDDGGRYLAAAPEAAFDLIFLDSDRGRYVNWWPDCKRALRSSGILVVDNAVSHRGELEPFMALFGSEEEFTACVVPVGNGEFLAARSGVRVGQP